MPSFFLNMKHTILFLILLIHSVLSFAQKGLKEQFYLFDSKMKGVTKADSAGFLMRVSKLSDSLWQFDTYKTLGPLTSSEQYRDENATLAEGLFTFYHATGYVDSTGRVINGRLNGDWNFCNDTGKVIKQKTYAMGKLLKTRDLLEEEKETKDKTDKADTSTVKRDESESEYVGGLPGWARYLNKNLRYPDRAMNYNMAGMVVVQFVVTTEGKTTDVAIFKSVEYSLDTEAMRMIIASPKWKPASQDGKLVKSYKRQPIIFAFSGN
jgi:periplasmic protein TonB